MGVPGFDSSPSLALEREFAASEGDYSLSPPPKDRVFHKETMAEPARVAAARDVDVEARRPHLTSAEPIADSSASGQADVAAEAPACSGADRTAATATQRMVAARASDCHRKIDHRGAMRRRCTPEPRFGQPGWAAPSPLATGPEKGQHRGQRGRPGRRWSAAPFPVAD